MIEVLVDNAIKHTYINGKVIIELNINKGKVMLKVKNKGEPIAENERSRIFDRFYRIDKARNRKEGRYGLGIAIASSIEEMHKIAGAPDNAMGQDSESSATTYNTAKDYIDSLNSDVKWIEYNSSTNTVKITSIEQFVKHCKNASKGVGAFDDLNRKQAENMVFGNDDSDALHFDTVLTDLLEKNKDKYSKYSDWNSSYVDEYTKDLKAVDKFNNGIKYRQNTYNPMYYLNNYHEGYKTSTVAPHWRIHTGINQGDTASTVEANLALALNSYDGVKDVDFETVGGQGHTTKRLSQNKNGGYAYFCMHEFKKDGKLLMEKGRWLSRR